MKNKKELVPIVVFHRHENYDRSVYKYQVFIGEYDRAHHVTKNISKNYECFNSIEEVEAYCHGLAVSGITYEGKRANK